MTRRNSVAAVVQRKTGVLVARRKTGGDSGGLWEFPGGKVESGERYREALVREFLEEFGVGLEVGRLICRVPFTNAGTEYRLYAFFAEPESDAFTLLEHDEIRWLALEEISRLELVESDRRVLEHLRAHPRSVRDGFRSRFRKE